MRSSIHLAPDPLMESPVLGPQPALDPLIILFNVTYGTVTHVSSSNSQRSGTTHIPMPLLLSLHVYRSPQPPTPRTKGCNPLQCVINRLDPRLIFSQLLSQSFQAHCFTSASWPSRWDSGKEKCAMRWSYGRERGVNMLVQDPQRHLWEVCG